MSDFPQDIYMQDIWSQATRNVGTLKQARGAAWGMAGIWRGILDIRSKG
jgi:hypothetical protein